MLASGQFGPGFRLTPLKLPGLRSHAKPQGDFADMKNTGPRFGGAITAALFLQKFIQKVSICQHLSAYVMPTVPVCQ